MVRQQPKLMKIDNLLGGAVANTAALVKLLQYGQILGVFPQETTIFPGFQRHLHFFKHIFSVRYPNHGFNSLSQAKISRCVNILKKVKPKRQ